MLNILPARGNLMTLTVKSDLVKKISITQEEMESVDMKSQDGKIFWDQSKEDEKEFEFTDAEKNLINDTLNSLNKSNSLDDESFALYKTFNNV